MIEARFLFLNRIHGEIVEIKTNPPDSHLVSLNLQADEDQRQSPNQ